MTETYQVRYSPAALEDLKTIYSYIALTLKAKQTAAKQVNRIRQTSNLSIHFRNDMHR